MALPSLTEEQRKEALAKAAEARKKRAELKGQLKSGKSTSRTCSSRSGDDTVGKMKVSTVLESLPGVGKVRAQKIMEELDISASRRVRGLGAKQREQLLARVRQEVGRSWHEGGLFVIAGPSGVGKGTVVRAPPAARTRRACSSPSPSRPGAPRPARGTGVDYFFVDDEQFDRMIADGRAAGVGGGLRPSLRHPRAGPSAKRRGRGRDVLLEIDVQGAGRSASAVPDAVLIFLGPRSQLPRRARAAAPERGDRGRREARAAPGQRPSGRSQQARSVRPRVVNDDLERAPSQVAAIIEERPGRA